jgi:hypothetical protein
LATVNIGNLTFTHRGDYDGSTAYAKNDVVYYATNGNAYIAKQATTGNVPTNGTYWSQFAQGSGGIWNAGLSLGSAGQVVKVNSGASALEFGTVSSDFVKLAEVNQSSDTTAIELQQFITSTYKNYRIFFNNILTVNQEIWARALTGTNTEYSSSNYYGCGDGYYKQYSGGSSGNQDQFSNIGTTYMRFTPGFYQDEDSMGWSGRITMDLTGEANKPLTINGIYYTPRYTNAYVYQGTYSNSAIDSTQTWTGLKLYMHSGGNIKNMDITIYGMKD